VFFDAPFPDGRYQYHSGGNHQHQYRSVDVSKHASSTRLGCNSFAKNLPIFRFRDGGTKCGMLFEQLPSLHPRRAVADGDGVGRMPRMNLLLLLAQIVFIAAMLASIPRASTTPSRP